MPHVGVRELQRNASNVLARVTRAERLIITRHNRPVAVLVGIEDAKQQIRSLKGVDGDTKRALLVAFQHWIWSDEPVPFRVQVAAAAGKVPVRKVDFQD
jgi:prevent-host-death family protein